MSQGAVEGSSGQERRAQSVGQSGSPRWTPAWADLRSRRRVSGQVDGQAFTSSNGTRGFHLFLGRHWAGSRLVFHQAMPLRKCSRTSFTSIQWSLLECKSSSREILNHAALPDRPAGGCVDQEAVWTWTHAALSSWRCFLRADCLDSNFPGGDS